MAVCGTCGSANREGRRFCAQCGAGLAVACGSCGAGNEPGERFCGDCGAALIDGSPPGTGAGPPSPEGERKQVTVLFADVSGSMDLQAGLDPEDWARVMDRFVMLLTEGVERYGGTIDKFTGDGIMALFGAPVAYEDHAPRACLAALAISSAVDEYRAELRQTAGLGFAIRLGLNSGEVVTGGVGGGSYTAVGHTVGLAQRMEALAEPGRIYLTEQTANLVGGSFALTDLGPRDVKGSPVPVRVFALDAVTPQRARGRASVELVGRDTEMAELEAALARAEAGETRVVGIVGQAGVGKSRLCEEFVRRCAERGITVRRASGLSHATSVPMLPIFELFRDYFGITADDSPSAARERIAGRLLLLDPAFADDLPLLFDFVEVPDPERPAPKLAPEARMRRIFEILRRLTQLRTEREAIVILLEDLHWFDPQSASFVERLIAQLPGSRTLVVANFRPEFTAPWLGASYYRSLPLAPLDAEAADGLLEAMLGTDASLAPLVPLVVDRTGGNPFFVEEVIRDLIDSGALAGSPGRYRLTRPVAEISVPPSVHATLAARIDRLPAEERRVLQTAAVIGRTFPRTILAAVAAAEVEDALTSLCARELLQATGSESCRFWHPLTQEVAAGTMLAERRARIHGAVARALIDAEPDRHDENSALIAGHWEAAGDTWEAAQWNARAAAYAYRHDVAEPLRRWQATMRQLEAIDHPGAPRLAVQARARLVRLGARCGMDDAELDRLRREARSLMESIPDDNHLAFELTIAAATSLFWRGHVVEAAEEYLRVEEIVESIGDPGLTSIVHVAAAFCLRRVGPVAVALAHVERSMRIAESDPTAGYAVLGYLVSGPGLFTRAELLALAGDLDGAREVADQATRVLRADSNQEYLGMNLSLYAQLARTGAEFEAALVHAGEAVQIAHDTANPSNRVIALGAQGVCLVGLERFEEAVTALTEGLAEARIRKGALFEEPVLLIHLARAHLGSGQLAEAAAAADEAVAVARRQGAAIVECHAHLTRARVGRTCGAPGEQVATDIAAGLDLMARTGAVVYEKGLRELA